MIRYELTHASRPFYQYRLTHCLRDSGLIEKRSMIGTGEFCELGWTRLVNLAKSRVLEINHMHTAKI